jgi:hypothetical protein
MSDYDLGSEPVTYKMFASHFEDGARVFGLVHTAHDPNMNWRKRKKLIRKGIIKAEWIEGTFVSGAPYTLTRKEAGDAIQEANRSGTL